MTEDEAKTKGCCGPWAVNWAGRSGEIDANRAQTCIGSACMAWRLEPSGNERLLIEAKDEANASRIINAIKALRQFDGSLGLKEAKDIADGVAPWPIAGRASGFCGLAGPPR